MHTHEVVAGHYPGCINSSDCWCETRRYFILLLYATAILAIEVIGGIYSGSLALLADAGHVLADNLAIMVSIVVAFFVKQKISEPSTIRKIGFIVNIFLLLAVVLYIVYEGIARIEHPRGIASWAMVAVATFGALGNWLQHKELAKVHSTDRHQTHRVLSAHVFSDLALSIGVIIGGIGIWIFEKPILDPIISLIIAGWILKMTSDLIQDSKGEHNH